MKKISKIVALLAFALVFPATGSAKDAYKECGIGAMIFDDNPTGAIISNIIWDLGTTALTSAAASEDSCKGKGAATAAYIMNTYANLEEETAKGEGKHITAMLNIMGCESASHTDIIGSIRGDVSKSMSNPANAEKSTTMRAKEYHEVVRNKVSTEYAAQCQII
ncbi:MAG: DUF3015 domain-containing protein [Gammaproteobacteria bacterium]|nr:DUF3015 domain-containing protein [Gammaproteobacteria bacterium]